MLDFLANLFNTDGFPPRWHCGIWTSGEGWLHILSDIAVFGAYMAIPCVLIFFVIRKRDIPFPRIFWLFALFIFACGFGHLLEAVIFWHPIYRFAGLVKLTTAIVSWATVVALVPIIPKALHLPGLAKLNNELRSEVEERRKVEAALRESEGKMANLLASEREARGQAERANRFKDEFLSTVSHELRTPLNAILGYAQLLLRSEHDSEEHESLTIIERNAKAQAQLIEDLLDMSRIISGKVRLDIAAVDLSQVVGAAIDTVRPTADAKNVRIESVLDSNVAPVLGDSGRLQQIVWNLLTNAIKFTGRGGKVQVTLKRVDSHLELQVSDTGQGIKAEFLADVFDRFRQADPSTTRRHGGLGLGLSIVKQLVELHGGSVEVASPGEGQGATFTVRLPVQIFHTGEATADRRSANREFDLRQATNVTLRGVRVLAVDDDRDARELIKRLLTDYDADVRVAASAKEALQMLNAAPADILLSDIGMPDMDGYELISAVRALPTADRANIAAAALTAFARSQDRTRALLAGFQAHITKPVDPAELVAVVASLTRRTGKTPDSADGKPGNHEPV
jgi:signal transduction histidine kinase/ActR/RegA family two-component response regulator